MGLGSPTLIVLFPKATVAALINCPLWVASAFLRRCTILLTCPKCWDLHWNVGLTFRSSCSGLLGPPFTRSDLPHTSQPHRFFLRPWHKIRRLCNSCVLCACNQQHEKNKFCYMLKLHPDPVSIAVPGKTSLDHYFWTGHQRGRSSIFLGTFLSNGC